MQSFVSRLARYMMQRHDRRRCQAESMLTPFERGLIAHMVADWLLQNDWMVKNKSSLSHPATWVHAAIHAVLLGLALGWQARLVLSALHLLLDTRVPLRWWQRMMQQTTKGPLAATTMIWVDQVIHVTAIGIWVAVATKG